MIIMERMTTLFKEIVTIQQERNEMLKDSIYAEFALSDEQVIEEAHKAFDSAFAKSFKKEFKEL